MDELRIAHISDLHFGSPRQCNVWNSLRDFLNGTLKPNFILVTGDIAHTPNRNLFERAATELNQLRVTRPNPQDAYRVCPGNHDRHPLGNAPGDLAAIFNAMRGMSGAPAWFDNGFQGLTPTVKNPHTVELQVGKNRWTIRIIGCDTSAHAKFTAHGYASEADLGGLDAAAKSDPDADLVILMHHHHLLPIMELEKSRQQLTDMFRPTIMLNAGTMLEALARGSVNMVLRGHEHHRFCARYGTMEGQQTETVIVGAGSATGNSSSNGCDIKRASFNLLELRRDRSVCLQYFMNDGIRWRRDGSTIQLLDSRAIRRARFYRSVSPESPPTSKIVKCIEFKPDRTIEMTQTWTYWTLEDGRWTHRTNNSSGIPTPANIHFEWQHDAPTSYVCEFFPAQQDHAYRIDIDFGKREEMLARRIVARFKWLGGGVLTEGDLELLDKSKVGDFRKSGKEFAGIHVYNELQSFSLMVRLPESFAPKPETVDVFYTEPGAPDDKLEPSEELREAVQFHARGMFSLEVPYPRKDYRYWLAWPVAERLPRGTDAEQFRRVAGDETKAQEMLKAFSEAIGRLPIATVSSLGLYIEGVSPNVVARVAKICTNGEAMEVPSLLSLTEGALPRHAWWGTIQLIVADERFEPPLVQGERAVALVPVKHLGREDDASWGIVRVGISAHAGVDKDELFAALNGTAAQEMFADGVISMLQKSIEFRRSGPCG